MATTCPAGRRPSTGPRTCACERGGGRITRVEVYADKDWYAARPDPEKTWRGVLWRREVPAGPSARTALTFALATGDRHLPVYAANAEHLLAEFVGRRVVAVGKLVDLSPEGYGEELWLGSLETGCSAEDGDDGTAGR